MAGDAGLHELIEALSDPRAYEEPPARVGVEETHISVVFLAGERAYKVKKPVDLGFLDFTTLELRRRFCEEEVRLNRRLAPGIYLGVVPITRDRTGRIQVGGDGLVVEWAVEMVRLPEERMLYALLDRGEIDNRLLNALADLLVRFHAEAATGEGVDELGRIDVIAGNARENFEQTRPFVGPAGGTAPTGAPRTLTPALHAFLESSAGEFLRTRRDLFERRLRGGRIREGHGDLHARNICCTEGGIVVYDCIEFNRRFRCADVACDLAFLAMDLDHRGFSGFSRQLVRRYAETAADRELLDLMTFYKAYRAVVRGKVASMTAASTGAPPERVDDLHREAMRYFHLAAAYDLPPSLVLMCGLPGTGKTWEALRLAGPLRAAVHRSDVRRKQIAGVPRTSRRREGFEEGLYSAGMTERVYRALREDAEAELRAGRTVIVDAAFPRRAQRGAFGEAARRSGRPFWILHVEAPEAVVRERLERRKSDAEEVSDADFAVYLHARRTFEPPVDAECDGVVPVASGAAASEEVAEALLERMIAGVRAAR